MIFDKLVRDKIPERIRAEGRTPITHVAHDNEYWQRLKAKLAEEMEEFMADETVEELADILEVIDAIIAFKHFDKEELHKVKEKKAFERGGFSERIVLEQA